MFSFICVRTLTAACFFLIFTCGSYWNTTVKELLKSVHICQSYAKNITCTFLWPTVYKNQRKAINLVQVQVIYFGRFCSYIIVNHYDGTALK